MIVQQVAVDHLLEVGQRRSQWGGTNQIIGWPYLGTVRLTGRIQIMTEVMTGMVYSVDFSLLLHVLVIAGILLSFNFEMEIMFCCLLAQQFYRKYSLQVHAKIRSQFRIQWWTIHHPAHVYSCIEL